MSSVKNLTAHERTEAYFPATAQIHEWVRDAIEPQLLGILRPSPRESAILVTYWRMCAWLATLVKLDEPRHYQAIAMAARSLFELVVDLEILAADRNGEEITRFHNFQRVEKYRVAEKVVEHRRRIGGTEDPAGLAKFVDDPTRADDIALAEKQLWPGIPKDERDERHWSGRKMRRRLEMAGGEYASVHTELYRYLSWHVHGGGVGIQDATQDVLESLIGSAHAYAQKFFLRGTEICAKELRIAQALEDFFLKLKEAQALPGFRLLEKLRASGLPDPT